MLGVRFSSTIKKKKKQALLRGCGVNLLLNEEEEKIGSSYRMWSSPLRSRRRKEEALLAGC